MAENKRIVTMNRLSEQRLLEENRALHSQVARLTYEYQFFLVCCSNAILE